MLQMHRFHIMLKFGRCQQQFKKLRVSNNLSMTAYSTEKKFAEIMTGAVKFTLNTFANDDKKNGKDCLRKIFKNNPQLRTYLRNTERQLQDEKKKLQEEKLLLLKEKNLLLGGPSPLIHVPRDIEFSRGVLDCQRPVTPTSVCSRENLIDLESTLAHAMDTVNRGLQADDRVAPLAFVRLARGGKTTFLYELFDQLKADNKKAVTFITLLNLIPREGETGRDVLLRLIALQLLPSLSFSEALNVKVDETALFEHIDATRGDRPWVLLIDELNNLGVPVDPHVADLLRKLLDRKGCFVVFTSHVPMTLSSVWRAHTYLGNDKLPVSDRGVTAAPLPMCTDASILSRMFSDHESHLQVTPSEVSMHLGIPSLIYVTKRYDNDPPAARFLRQYIIVEQEDALGVLQSFVGEVLTGQQDPRKLSTRFYLFGQMPEEMRIQWPICYIACILDMPAFDLRLDIQGAVKRLAVQQTAQGTTAMSGLDWPMVVHVAILLQSLNAKVNSGRGPFDIVDDRQCECVVTHELPVDVVTIEAANAHIDSELAACGPGTILVATPTYTQFPDYDVIVAYKRQNGTVRKFGVQIKPNRAYPSREVADCLEAGFLVRGCAPITANSNTTGRWKHCGEQAVKALVGSSLAPLIPETWPVVPAVDAYD